MFWVHKDTRNMPYFVIWVVFNNSGDIILVHVITQLQLEKICLRNKVWSNSGGSPGFTVCDWLMFCKISFALIISQHSKHQPLKLNSVDKTKLLDLNCFFNLFGFVFILIYSTALLSRLFCIVPNISASLQIMTFYILG